MVESGARVQGPAGIILPPTPLQFARSEQARLRQAIRQAEEFSERVRAGIGKVADPQRFHAGEQARLGTSIKKALAFTEQVNDKAGRRVGPKQLASGRSLDTIA